MIRVRHIDDPQLKAKVIAKLAESRGLTPAEVPEWFEMDDHDFVDVLNAIRDDENPVSDRPDPRE